jgi:hypothetical protein
MDMKGPINTYLFMFMIFAKFFEILFIVPIPLGYYYKYTIQGVLCMFNLQMLKFWKI